MRINNNNMRIAAICFVYASLCIAGCKPSSPSPVGASQSVDSVVTNNLRHIWSVLRDTVGDSDSFPKTFAELNQPGLDTNLFVCPGTGSRAGTMRSVEEWTDYIYIGNAWEGIPRAVLVISPPQNHGGKYGYAVCVDGYITRLTEIQIRALVDEPWGLDTNASVSNINYLKKQIFVNVPKKWRRYYLRPN